MALDPDLTTSLEGIDRRKALQPFQWLVGNDATLMLVSALGDLFFADGANRVKWLDVGSGRLEDAADDEAQFWRRTNEPKFSEVWFSPELISAIRRAGLRRGADDCYCFLRLPMLGGEYEPTNFTVRHVLEYIKIWGPILERTWQIPDGTRIRFKESP